MQAKSLSFPSFVYLANLVFAGQDLNYKGKGEEEGGVSSPPLLPVQKHKAKSGRKVN